MIFPFGDDNVKGGAFPIFSYLLLAVNIIIFFLTITNGQASFDTFGANPCEIKQGMSYYSLFTSMFLHANLMHLIGNMLFLWIFADNIEASIGNFRFLLFYFLGGLIAAMAHIIISTDNGCMPMVGASGAIAAVMGAYFIMFPRSRIKILFFIRIIYLPALIFLGLWIIQQILQGFTDLGFNGQGSRVAFWAHIGGFIFGMAFGVYFKLKNPKLVLSADETLKENNEISVQ